MYFISFFIFVEKIISFRLIKTFRSYFMFCLLIKYVYVVRPTGRFVSLIKLSFSFSKLFLMSGRNLIKSTNYTDITLTSSFIIFTLIFVLCGVQFSFAQIILPKLQHLYICANNILNNFIFILGIFVSDQ